jgi:beta-glucanase (GH16 family)
MSIMNISRESLLKDFTVDENGIITSSIYGGIRNPFVGQPLYVAWYWINFYEPVSGGEDEDENEDAVILADVTHEDIEDFPELVGREGKVITIKREIRYKISEVKEGEPYKSL